MVSCVIVDDEPIARDIIRNYCSHLPQLRVAGECGNALEAKSLLQQQPTGILFLDIHLPVLDGIGFLKTLKNPPQVIFTTAYKEYAANAFDLAACDYLVKPFSLDRFIVAVDRALEKLYLLQPGTPAPAFLAKEENFFIRANGKVYNLHHHEFVYAEAKGNYTRIVTTHHSLLPNIPLSSFEMLLPAGLGIRVHRSFIINRSKISHIEGNMVYIGKAEIPVGSNYKAALWKQLGI
jgi:DNA-binding LytR/AlgR family response regulator